MPVGRAIFFTRGSLLTYWAKQAKIPRRLARAVGCRRGADGQASMVNTARRSRDVSAAHFRAAFCRSAGFLQSHGTNFRASGVAVKRGGTGSAWTEQRRRRAYAVRILRAGAACLPLRSAPPARDISGFSILSTVSMNAGALMCLARHSNDVCTPATYLHGKPLTFSCTVTGAHLSRWHLYPLSCGVWAHRCSILAVTTGSRVAGKTRIHLAHGIFSLSASPLPLGRTNITHRAASSLYSKLHAAGWCVVLYGMRASMTFTTRFVLC